MKKNVHSKNVDEIEIDLNKLYHIIKNDIKWLVMTPITCILIAIIYILFIAKPIYTSEAKILIVGGENYQSSLLGLANQIGLTLPSRFNSDDSYLSVETLPEILKSRSLTKSILLSEFSTDQNSKPKMLLDILFKQSDTGEIDRTDLIARGQKLIAEDILDVEQINKTMIVSLTANSSTPYLSAQIVQKVILELMKMQLDFKKSELQFQRGFIIDRLEEVQDALYSAESRLKNFRENNLQINLSPSLLLEQERLEREIEIQTEVYIALKQQYEQIKIEESKSISSIKVIDEPNIPIKASNISNIIILALSTTLGLIVGCIIAIIKNHN